MVSLTTRFAKPLCRCFTSSFNTQRSTHSPLEQRQMGQTKLSKVWWLSQWIDKRSHACTTNVCASFVASLHKFKTGRDFPLPQQIYAAATGQGRPSMLKRLKMAARTCSSTTWLSKRWANPPSECPSHGFAFVRVRMHPMAQHATIASQLIGKRQISSTSTEQLFMNAGSNSMIDSCELCVGYKKCQHIQYGVISF